MDSFYSPEELKALGLKEYGEDVRISRKCSIYGAGKISLGSHVRIDDFCLLSGKISLGSYVHIAAGAIHWKRPYLPPGDHAHAVSGDGGHAQIRVRRGRRRFHLSR